ncbi:MAG: DUF308 domain-containing protein [Clostridia bacterium]|nr:DUF308 domain-containing protein [Clostridia bacterium]
MKSIVKNMTNYMLLFSVLAVFLGIVLIAWPGMSLLIFGYIVAAYLVVQGVALIILDIKSWSMYVPFHGMLQGILNVILGVLIAKSPGSIAVYIGIVVGIWIIVSGIEDIRLAFSMRRTGAPWILMLIISIIDIIIGGTIIYSPILSSLSITIVVGIVMIVHSIINIVCTIVIKKNAKEIENMIVEKSAVINAEQDAGNDTEA